MGPYSIKIYKANLQLMRSQISLIVLILSIQLIAAAPFRHLKAVNHYQDDEPTNPFANIFGGGRNFGGKGDTAIFGNNDGVDSVFGTKTSRSSKSAADGEESGESASTKSGSSKSSKSGSIFGGNDDDEGEDGGWFARLFGLSKRKS